VLAGENTLSSTKNPGTPIRLRRHVGCEYNSVYLVMDRIFDGKDVEILRIIQSNARVSQADIARHVDLAPSAVLERIRKLEARGAITGYAALLNPKMLDHGMLAFVAVRTGGMNKEEAVSRAVAKLPEVLEVHHVAGEDCLLLKVRTRDAEQLGQLLRTSIGKVPGVTSTRTTIVLETMKETPRVPVRAAEEIG
jgi:Lrp/AsnC family transcriptional regulator, leucine-responsive regulatory protein